LANQGALFTFFLKRERGNYTFKVIPSPLALRHPLILREGELVRKCEDNLVERKKESLDNLVPGKDKRSSN
jgi:hypothetical protein